MKLTANMVKKFAKACGADICRMGSMSGWEGAPKQMDPRYIFPDAKTIIGLGFRIPRGYLRGIEEGTFFSIYEFMGYSGMNWRYMPHVLRQIVCFIEDHGYEAVPIPNWDAFSYNGYTDYPNENGNEKQRAFRSRAVAPGLPCPVRSSARPTSSPRPSWNSTRRLRASATVASSAPGCARARRSRWTSP